MGAELLLSDRELAVLALLADKLTRAEIGAAMVISVNTVRTHVRHNYKKLAVHDRDQAVLQAQQRACLRERHRSTG